MPSGTAMMALTATATTRSRIEICFRLGMNDPFVVQSSPDKPNVYLCCDEFQSISASFGPLAEQLKCERTQMGRVIIFFKKLTLCSQIYSFFCLCYVKSSWSLQMLV